MVSTKVTSFLRSCVFLCAVLAVGPMLGCAATELAPAPAPGIDQVDTRTARATTATGIALQARVDDWMGRRDILEHVMPIRITLDNSRGDVPLRVRFTDLRLVMADGRSLAALPPYLPRQRVAVYSPVSRPAFEHASFSVAPHVAYLYPSLPPASASFDYEAPSHERYLEIWQETGLPTSEMLKLALPEGDVEAGGMASGFVYFEPVDAGASQLEVHARIVNAETGLTLDRVVIPFAVR